MNYTNVMKHLLLCCLLALPLLLLASEAEEIEPDSNAETLLEEDSTSRLPMDWSYVLRISQDWVAIYKLGGEIVYMPITEYERLLKLWTEIQEYKSKEIEPDTTNTPNSNAEI